MSSVSEQEHLNPKDPLSYAPRWLREKREAEPAPAGAVFDTQLEKAVSEALRHPLDPEVIEEPEELTRELRKMAILGVAGRFAAAVGVSALVALFFVVMIPASRVRTASACPPPGSSSRSRPRWPSPAPRKTLRRRRRQKSRPFLPPPLKPSR